MIRQRLIAVVLLAGAAALVALLVLLPRLGQKAVLTGYVEAEPL